MVRWMKVTWRHMSPPAAGRMAGPHRILTLIESLSCLKSKYPYIFLARWGFRLAETDVIGYFFRYKVIIRS